MKPLDSSNFLNKQLSTEFVYHAVPGKMFGDILYPLNRLQALFPEFYKTARAKYAWRTSTLDAKIPKLDCLWGDVIHISPIYPPDLFKALSAQGLQGYPNFEFFEIPVSAFKSKKAVIYTPPPPPLLKQSFSPDQQAEIFEIKDEEIAFLEDSNLDLHRTIPVETLNYYAFEHQHNRRPLVFYGTSHVLLHDELNTKTFKRIHWQDQ